MRKKEELLRDVREDIKNPEYEGYKGLWVEYRKIEVLTDIRDMLNDLTTSLRLFAKNLDLKK